MHAPQPGPDLSAGQLQPRGQSRRGGLGAGPCQGRAAHHHHHPVPGGRGEPGLPPVQEVAWQHLRQEVHQVSGRDKVRQHLHRLEHLCLLSDTSESLPCSNAISPNKPHQFLHGSFVAKKSRL